METSSFERQSINSDHRKPDRPETDGESFRFIEMDAVLQRIPKIEGIFDPDEEVRKLTLNPKEQRKRAVTEFEEKLAR
ncbi:MAG: hypothetical protein PHU56_02350, partial [Candidatus Pacebacteria bacterium]|nr:hypothetical protein [Candidatus Paceibacterota bacterium]